MGLCLLQILKRVPINTVVLIKGRAGPANATQKVVQQPPVTSLAEPAALLWRQEIICMGFGLPQILQRVFVNTFVLIEGRAGPTNATQKVVQQPPVSTADPAALLRSQKIACMGLCLLKILERVPVHTFILCKGRAGPTKATQKVVQQVSAAGHNWDVPAPAMDMATCTSQQKKSAIFKASHKILTDASLAGCLRNKAESFQIRQC